jgi:hypothetical protein
MARRHTDPPALRPLHFPRLTSSQGHRLSTLRAAVRRCTSFRCSFRPSLILGNWAYLRNYIEVTMTRHDDGTPVRRSGYTLTILRKEGDGRWRLARDANLLTVEQ